MIMKRFLVTVFLIITLFVLQDEQELFALIVDADDMYFADIFQILRSFAPVKHGRQLQHHVIGLLHQQG